MIFQSYYPMEVLRKTVKLRKQLNGLDCIIGGHSHTEMDEAEHINGTWIHQSGCWAKYLGKLTLEVDDQFHVVSACGRNMLWRKKKIL